MRRSMIVVSTMVAPILLGAAACPPASKDNGPSPRADVVTVADKHNPQQLIQAGRKDVCWQLVLRHTNGQPDDYTCVKDEATWDKYQKGQRYP